MKRIGITGQNGFIGTHLFNYLSLFKDKYILQEFKNVYFDDIDKLSEWISSCDVIFHLAGMNRHTDPNIVYQTNMDLTEKLILAINKLKVKPHVIFSSSTQEEFNNSYGLSKRKSREILIDWANKENVIFTGMIIPNVFGPFCKPYYNSVIATFCYQLTHNEIPKIDIDKSVKFIYIDELIYNLEKSINTDETKTINVNYSEEKKVSEILEILQIFKNQYYDLGIFPELKNSFYLNLFNTFRSYIDLENFPRNLKMNIDNRGMFVETIKSIEGGQISFSTTLPGIIRGNHFHTRKIERFAVIKGNAQIQLRKIGTDQIFNFILSGKEPSYVDIPIWYTHNITNIGDSELLTIFWINEFFDPNNPDTFFEVV